MSKTCVTGNQTFITTVQCTANITFVAKCMLGFIFCDEEICTKDSVEVQPS